MDSAKIWEDNEFMAILDVNPNTKGMALILTKKHYVSYVFDMPEEVYFRMMAATKKVARALEKKIWHNEGCNGNGRHGNKPCAY